MNRPLPVEALLPALGGGGAVKSLLRSAAERLTGVKAVRRLLERAAARPEAVWADRVLAAHRIIVSADGVSAALPAAGPVIVVANHPFGAADALALLSLCQQRRPDIKFMGNAVLATIPALAPQLIPMEILTTTSPARNLAPLRQSLAHLKKGGILGIFPAGAVSFFQWRVRRVEDPAWSLHVAGMAVKCGATVVPVRFAGRNPWWFQSTGMFHPLLRSALLLPAFLAGRGRTVCCAAGPPIPAPVLAALDSPAATALLRAAVAAIPLPPSTP